MCKVDHSLINCTTFLELSNEACIKLLPSYKAVIIVYVWDILQTVVGSRDASYVSVGIIR